MKNDDIKKILIETNQFCNLSCKYCFYNDCGRSDKYIKFDDIKKICKKYINLQEVYLTGGECELNEDFEKSINFLSKNYDVILFTNGLDIEKYINQISKKIKKLIVTFDSFDEKYDLRNNKNEKILNNIKKIVSLCQNKLEVKICLNKRNYQDFEYTIKKLIDIGVVRFSINYIKNIKSLDCNLELNDKEVKKTLSIIYKYIDYFDKKTIDFIKKSYDMNFKNEVNCIAGKNYVYIDVFGNEHCCPSFDDSLNMQKECNCFGKHCINIWEMLL